jgi:hypothetical protein
MPMVHPHTLPMKLEQGDRSLRSPTRPNGALHDSATGIRVMRALARPVSGRGDFRVFVPGRVDMTKFPPTPPPPDDVSKRY